MLWITLENPPPPSNTDTYESSQYSNEAYDYPPNIRESFNDLGRTITDKVNLLSHAKTPGEAQAAFTAPPSAKPQPKTFSHAIARASLAGSQLLVQTNPSSTSEEDPLATALEKYALASEKVGEVRLAQDQQIQQRFLAGWSTTLNTNLMFATRARRGVENARLGLDATKAKGKGSKGEDDLPMSDEHRAEVERKEDNLVAVTEDAVGVMKNVRVHPLPHGGECTSTRLLTQRWMIGPRHTGTFTQSRRSYRCAAGVSQKGLRDLKRAGTCC